MLCLPPAPCLSSNSKPHLRALAGELRSVGGSGREGVVIKLLKGKGGGSGVLRSFCEIVGEDSVEGPQCRFVLLASVPGMCRSSRLPSGVRLFHALGLGAVLPLYSLTLASSRSST